MRALLINQVFYPSSQATAQYLAGLAEGLVKRGHAVTILCSRQADEDHPLQPSRETWQGIEIIRVGNTGLGRGAKWRRAVDFLSFLVAAYCRSVFLPRQDLVVTLTTPPLVSALGAILGVLWRARFVYWVMDLFPDEAVAVGWLREEAFTTRVMEKISRLTLRRADRIVVLDKYMRERLVGKSLRAEKVAAIPVWIQREVTFDPSGRESFRAKHGLDGKHVVMYSGNHSPCHPLDTLMEARRLLNGDTGLHFCFVGGGTEWGKWRVRAQEEAWMNATFLGYQPFNELSASLSAADTQVVVMGDPFVGIIHPCKVYNFLAARRSFVCIGPERSHITDLIQEAGLETVAASFRHGESLALAAELQRRRAAGEALPWPSPAQMNPWSEAAILERMVAALEG